MGIEEFPTIENFQRLPKRLIVKGGDSLLTQSRDAVLSGLVINNLGQTVREVVVHLVVFNDKEIPEVNLSVKPDPDRLTQGTMASFSFLIEKFGKPVKNFYLYANWKYDDAGWNV